MGACTASVQHPPSAPAPGVEAPIQTGPCEPAQTEEAVYLCAHADYDRAEAERSNLEYELSKVYDGRRGYGELFAEAVAEWVEFREAECWLLTYDSRGGTAFESYKHRCLQELAQQRVVRLRSLHLDRCLREQDWERAALLEYLLGS